MQLGIEAVQRGLPTNDLNDVGTRLRRQLIRRLFHRQRSIPLHLDLHQLICLQRVIQRLQQRLSDPVMADVNRGAQMVRRGA